MEQPQPYNDARPRRRAVATHNGSFVWGDSSDVDVTSIAANSFTVRASGGFEFFTNAGLTTGATMSAGSGSWNNLSDRNMKENVQTVDPRRILENVLSMPITTWNYTTQDDSIRHIGPMAQDFHQAFNLGEDDRHITTIDADGVALAAIQGLHQVIRERDAQINSQQQRIEALRMEKDSQIAAQQDQIEQLRNRLARLEATLNESTALKGNARQ